MITDKRNYLPEQKTQKLPLEFISGFHFGALFPKC